MPFAKMYKNIDIVQTYDSKSLVEEKQKYLAITMPDFSTQSVNPPAPIHHKFGLLGNDELFKCRYKFYLL